MKEDTFILDQKVMLPRMSRLRTRLIPETRLWRDIKLAVAEGRPLDWTKIIREFRYGDIIGPNSLQPASRSDHMRLKGLYAFLQMGYVIVDDSRVAVFKRQGHHITSGYSPLVSSSALGLRDHSAAERKFNEQMRTRIAIAKVEPFAVGYREIKAERGNPSPAYLWLLHKVTLEDDLPIRRQPDPDHDAFVGVKDIAKLLRGQVKSSGRTIELSNPFDLLLLEFLSTSRSALATPDAAIRVLGSAEVESMPRGNFKVRHEHLRRRLKLLGLLAGGTALLTLTEHVLDWGQRSDWVSAHKDELVDFLKSIAETAKALFQ